MVLTPLAADAADRRVHMVVVPPVLKDVAAMPQIADPADDAERRINAAVRQFDTAVQRAAAGCRDQDGKATWTRSVAVPMRGPGYISFAITDGMDCGGAYPNDGLVTAIVYDLRTGKPIEWPDVLPAALTGKLALAAGPDGTKMITLASKRLTALYLAGYPADQSADCREAVQSQTADAPPPMMAWLSAKPAGLVVTFDLPHVIAACAEPVLIPAATLRAEGARPALLSALDEATAK
jgi:hypothetical protein